MKIMETECDFKLMTDGNMGESGKGPINIDLGKEIDRSLAEIVTALLKPPATALGSLVGDTIGLISDRVRRKRERNAQLGMEEVRSKLEAASVSIDEITPPKEEELHLLVTGLSLSDDENLRSMWAGLFAKALDPAAAVEAERPYLSLLQSLSPLDAKIIHFLAFTVKADEELRRNLRNFSPSDFSKVTPEEKEMMEEVRKENWNRRSLTIKLIEEKAENYGLHLLSGPEWSENLMRQGIIENRVEIRRPSDRLNLSSLDERGLLQAFEHLTSHINYMEQKEPLTSISPGKLIDKEPFNPEIQITVRFTEFGKRFGSACGVL